LLLDWSGFLVGLHELGHLLTAKDGLGMRSWKNFLSGFLPKSAGFQWERLNIRYGAISTRGFVKISEDDRGWKFYEFGIKCRPNLKPWSSDPRPAWPASDRDAGRDIVNGDYGIIIFVFLFTRTYAKLIFFSVSSYRNGIGSTWN